MASESWLLVGGLVAIVVAVVHSALGEVLIFQRMRKETIVPTQGQPVLRERYVRILWATWHIVSVFGLAIAGVLVFMSLPRLVSPSGGNFNGRVQRIGTFRN